MTSILFLFPEINILVMKAKAKSSLETVLEGETDEVLSVSDRPSPLSLLEADG